MADVQKTVLGIAIALIMVATIFVIGVNLLGNEDFVSTYNQSITLTDGAVVYLSNSEIVSGSLIMRNDSTPYVTASGNYTIDETTGKITCVADMAIHSGHAYSAQFRKDKVDTTVQTIIVTVLSIIAAIVIVRRMLKG